MLRVLAASIAALPFAFALIRVVQTGTDTRYVWVALGAMVGGMIVTLVTRRFRRPLHPVTLAAAVFVMSAIVALAVALVLGTRFGPGVLVVTGSFAGCFASASLASVLARRD